jgi:hypothetical protein
MRKLGFSQKTLSLMTESQIKMILEKIKKKENKEAVQTTTYNTTDSGDATLLNKKTPEEKSNLQFNPDGTVVSKSETKEAITKTVYQPRKNPADAKAVQDMVTKANPNVSVELDERKKTKNKKYNPWAVCTSSVGRKNKKKFEDCVMGVKKKLKEGRNPYEYLIESKMEEIVENNLSPKMTKGEIMSIIAEKKMMMKKPIGTMIGGEMGEGDTKTAPAPTRTTPKTDPGTKPSHPGRRSKEQPNPKPKAKKSQSDSEMESKKSEIITAISNLIDKALK